MGQTRGRSREPGMKGHSWSCFHLPRLLSLGAYILTTLTGRVSVTAMQPSSGGSSAWAFAGGCFSPRGSPATQGGACSLLGSGKLGLPHTCSELPGASATLALCTGPNRMRPRSLMGHFLKACISIPCRWCPGYRAFGVAPLLQEQLACGHCETHNSTCSPSVLALRKCRLSPQALCTHFPY